MAWRRDLATDRAVDPPFADVATSAFGVDAVSCLPEEDRRSACFSNPDLPRTDKALRRARAASRALRELLALIAIINPAGCGVDFRPFCQISVQALLPALVYDKGQALTLRVIIVADQTHMMIGISPMTGLEFLHDTVNILFTEEG